MIAEVSSFQLEVDPLVQAAHLADQQHHPRPPRPLPLDGRVRRGQVPHLRQPGAGRHLRRQPRRPDRGRRAGRGRQPRSRPRALWFAAEPRRESALYLRNGETIVYAPPTGDPRPVAIMRVDEIPLRGRHNVENAMARDPGRARRRAGRRGDPGRRARLRPLAHRLEPVATIDGVEYVDDSKATNPGSVIAALRAFEQRPIVLIAGGKAKGTDFAELGKAISSRAKAVVLIGEAAGDMAAVVKRAKVERAGVDGRGGRAGARRWPSRATWCCSRRAARRSTCSTRPSTAASSSPARCARLRRSPARGSGFAMNPNPSRSGFAQAARGRQRAARGGAAAARRAAAGRGRAAGRARAW